MVYRVRQTQYFDDTAHRGARPPLDGDIKAVGPGLTGLVKGWLMVEAMVPIVSLNLQVAGLLK